MPSKHSLDPFVLETLDGTLKDETFDEVYLDGKLGRADDWLKCLSISVGRVGVRWRWDPTSGIIRRQDASEGSTPGKVYGMKAMVPNEALAEMADLTGTPV
jgi:hypothetical protein